MNQTELAVDFGATVDQKTSVIAKDLRLNLKRLIEQGTLTPQDAHLAILAVAAAVEYEPLKNYARHALAEFGFPAEQIAEAAESSAMMAMLNVYYRFRHMVGNEEDYRVAGLRMTALARPTLGKTRFEMLAFALSVLNGCESCIRSHEEVLRNEGFGTDKIHDLARLAAVVKALKTLSNTH